MQNMCVVPYIHLINTRSLFCIAYMHTIIRDGKLE
uniref:Uncharacterized protein n=1 Tax=Arundo donax TaxID=35708 RepID=A0A0A9AN93_ARUDO